VRIAGVRLIGGSAVWLDAGDLSAAPLDRATVRIDGSIRAGEVFVAPEQVLSPPDRVDGLLVESHAPQAGDEDCDYLPGAELPTLGQAVQWGSIRGTVVALDPVEDRVTIEHSGDTQMVISLGDISGG
jgi:hypothetical protein